MQKYVNLVDLVKSFPTSIYLQKSASIQPRTSLSKFGGKFNSLFIRLLRPERPASPLKTRLRSGVDEPGRGHVGRRYQQALNASFSAVSKQKKRLRKREKSSKRY